MSLARIPSTLAHLVVLCVLPLLILVRGSIAGYERGYSTAGAILGAAAAATAVLTIYAALLSRRLTGRARFAAIARWIAVPVITGWCFFALFSLAAKNAKTPEVRKSFVAVHPILRIALSTVILADRELVVTDMRRVVADYDRMGLPVFHRSLHLAQPDGWVHAADLRTTGHGELRNRLLELYFRAMGFDTLRHVGTADHLHVQLAVR